MKAVPAVLLLVTAGCAVPRSNVVLVTLDGTRWQEIFGGADPSLIENRKYKEEGRGTRQAFWRDTPEERRRALTPFLWETVARRGQLLGNVHIGSQILVTNRYRVSYPGYHELLCGFPSELIVSNKKIPNPDVTVLEWLNRRPGFEGSVAAFCSWDVFLSILNRERCGFPIDVGEPKPDRTLVHRLAEEVTAPWHGSVYDAFVFHSALEYVREKRPRVLYLALGDTDEWAHAGAYERYLESLHREDAWLGELWAELQSMPEYAGTTTLLVTCDHGRGDNPAEWRSHNSSVRGAGDVWVAVIGPHVAPRGEASDHEPLLQGQVAATVAAAVGEDYPAGVPAAPSPLPIFVPSGR